MSNNDELLKKLLVTFQGEAEDHIRSISTLLIDLEREPDDEELKRLVETLYRKMHTLKGAAQAVNMLDVGEMCQSLESLLAALKRGEITLGVDLFDKLHAAVDSLDRRISHGEVNAATVEGANIKRLVRELDAPLKENEPVTKAHCSPPAGPARCGGKPFRFRWKTVRKRNCQGSRPCPRCAAPADRGTHLGKTDGGRISR